jgi:uncharacterized protein (DUF362 family)
MTESRMSPTAVTLTRCDDYTPEKVAACLHRHFELLGGIGTFIHRGDSVLIKPNLIAPRSHRYATQTHPAVIIELARLIKDFGAKPFVGDSPAWTNTANCARKLRLTEPLKKLGVPLRQLSKPTRCTIDNQGTKVSLSSVALDADVIINLPKFKSHQQLVATFAVKNMFGCVCGKRKAYWHFARGAEGDFCRLLLDIYRYLKPGLTIIDAVMAMDGPGPIRGRTRPLGWLIAGTEPIALERTCCRLIDISPDDLPIIRAAEKMHFGSSATDTIEVLGDSFTGRICTDFQRATPIPIRFSLFHVCKSFAKQVTLLAKSALGREPADSPQKL